MVACLLTHFRVHGTPAASGWSTNEGIGSIYSNADDTVLRGFYRSGYWSANGSSGVLMLYLNYTPSGASSDVGFRVAR